jgi:ADP-ribosyl-[dinitrogen reductase] hydrolase
MEGNGVFMMKTQHAIGALVGSAVGDALGAPFEFQRPGLYRATYPSPVVGGIGEMRGGGGFGWKPAEFTDDTQMALALAESLIARNGFDPADLWQRWRTWAETARDVGAQTRTVLDEKSHIGVAERFHMQRGKSAGNGSVMRNTPIALWAAEGSLENLIDLAGRQASLTHHDPHNAYGAAIHAAMIRAGIRGEDVFDAIESALAVLPSEARDLWTPLLASGWSPDTSSNNGAVWDCLAEAVWAVRNAATFEEAVVSAVDLGRDADTVACVAGGIAGARWGVQSIPSRWTTYLNGTVLGPNGDAVYDYASLQSLALRLLGKHAPVDPADEPAGGPVRVHEKFPIYAANRTGAAEAPDDWQVISLCRTGDAFTKRNVRRQVFLVDKADPHHNENPLAVLEDVVATIDALLAEDASRPILVHCHGGRSRTAFVLKGWAMRRFGWTEEQAHDWLVRAWPRIDRMNGRFVEILRSTWRKES